MATKTVINSNATRGISILIDQPQQQVVGSQQQQQQQQQRHATAKINISPVATTTTYAASTSSTTSSAYSSLGSDGQPAAMTMNSNQHYNNNNNNNNNTNNNNNYSTTFIDINCQDDADQNSRTGPEPKKSTATFPQLLLRVAAAAAASQDQVNINQAATTTTTITPQLSERRKTKANGESVGAEKPENSERVHHVGQSVGISITHEHNNKQLQQPNHDVVTTLPATTTTTTIIQCNSTQKNKNDDYDDNDNDDDDNGHNNNHDVAVARDAIVESRLSGDGAPLVVVAAAAAAAATTGTSSTSLSQRPEQLENFVATNSLELADCASALTESVESVESNAVKDSHVVKIKISPNTSETRKNSKSNTIEINKVGGEKLQSAKNNNISGENNLSKVSLVQLQNEPVTQVTEKLVTKIENLKFKVNDKMVQKPCSTATTLATTTTQGTTTSGNTTVTELNVSNPATYLYYMMSSGQFSPCDTLDSGTGSDLESNGNNNNNNISNNNNNNANSVSPKLTTITTNGATNKLELHLKTTKIRMHVGGGGGGVGDKKHHSASNGDHQRAGSLTDSEESESSLSCDSLNSSEYLRHSTISLTNGHSVPKPPPTPTSLTPPGKSLGSFLPDSLLRDIRDRKFPTNDFISKYVDNNHDQSSLYDAIEESAVAQTHNGVASMDYQVVESHVKFARGDTMTQRVSLPNKTFILNAADGTFVDTKMNSMPRTYEADKFYDFHVNEHENFRSFGGGCDGSEIGDTCSEAGSWMDYEPKSQHEDAFAGYKDIRCSSAASTIRSSKGTVRGVKNRVRNGIATFLQLQQPNVKNFKEKDLGKVVLYTTSMGIIRDTYAKCSNVKQILRTLLVKFEERDVFMSVEYQQEIKERMHSEAIKVPQLFVEGQHIGDADTVERLNESGELRQLLKPYKSISTTYTCQTCGGYRLLPCPSCNGSKKSVHRNHFTAEFVALKCMNCDEVGLVKCHNC